MISVPSRVDMKNGKVSGKPAWADARLVLFVPAAMFLLGGLGQIGCAGGGEVGGLWKSPEEEIIPAEALHPGFEGQVALSVGQFGKDVAGTVFLFTDGYSKVSVFQACPCLYLEQAEFSGGTLTFRAQRCDGQSVLAELELVVEGDEEFLRGTVSDEDGTVSELELVQEADDETVRDEEWNVGCQVP